MTGLTGMIDLHSHLLPNVDDGSRSLEQSTAVLSHFARHGISDVVMTPHLRASDIVPTGEAAIERRDGALAALRSAAPDGVRLHSGFEIMLDEPLPEVVQGDRRFALAHSRYYLVEFPFSIVGGLATGILERMQRSGIVPLVAHPERYSTCGIETIRQWRQVGARMQVDATTLVRKTVRGRKARALVAAGLADVLAADNHGDRRSLATGAAYLDHHGAAAVAGLLTVQNPQAVLEDGDMVDAAKATLREPLIQRLRRWLEA